MLLVLCLSGAVFQIWLLWGTEYPLGVPGEWTWSRLKLTDSFWLDLLPAFITGGLLIGYFGLTWEKNPANRPYQSFFWLTGLFVLGLCVWCIWLALFIFPKHDLDAERQQPMEYI